MRSSRHNIPETTKETKTGIHSRKKNGEQFYGVHKSVVIQPVSRRSGSHKSLGHETMYDTSRIRAFYLWSYILLPYLNRRSLHSNFPPRNCFIWACSRVTAIEFLCSIYVNSKISPISHQVCIARVMLCNT